MNYGYDEDGFSPEISKEYENERFPAQLYHHTATQIDISNMDLLEVGSGRGGGASYVQQHLNTGTVTGLDISSDAIKLSESSFDIPGLSFLQGDSENLPFEKSSFDIILNVESSHCYGDTEKFFVEVQRVLKNGGYFLWCDFRTNKEMDLLFETFLRSGFIIEKEKDITKNIMSALDIVTPLRKEQIDTHVPKAIRRVFESYAGVAGGSVNNAFLNGELVYKSAALKVVKD